MPYNFSFLLGLSHYLRIWYIYDVNVYEIVSKNFSSQTFLWWNICDEIKYLAFILSKGSALVLDLYWINNYKEI